jgi:hypothetical protein
VSASDAQSGACCACDLPVISATLTGLCADHGLSAVKTLHAASYPDWAAVSIPPVVACEVDAPGDPGKFWALVGVGRKP